MIEEAHARVRDLYGSTIGGGREAPVTPALILDLDLVRSNTKRIHDRLATLPAKLRPHVKTHKSPHLARMQMEGGAIGICTATVWEAAVMAEAGILDIFVVNEVVDATRIRTLVGLAAKTRILVAVDDAGNAAELSRAASAAGVELGVLIDVNNGQQRCGVDTAEAALDLARAIAPLPGLRFDGLTGYEGHCSMELDGARRAEMQRDAMAMFVGVADLLEANGIPCRIMSAGGTATWDRTAAHPRITEIQAGSYLLMDRYHDRMVGGFAPALTVLATVVSRQPGRLVTDCGSKSIGDPDISVVLGHDLKLNRFDEEHGLYEVDNAYPLRIGARIELMPGYTPYTINYYDAYHVMEGGRIVDIWPVIPRGPMHHGFARS
jgi:D-serine deaminase-like pyridoxal phosphate-dependent protein